MNVPNRFRIPWGLLFLAVGAHASLIGVHRPADRSANPDSLSPSLDSLYAEGVEAMGGGRFGDAEQCFLAVLMADSNDWDARERLALLYRWEGRTGDCDRELDILRRMQARGTAWREYIWRDQFILKDWRIMAVETPAHARQRKYLFAVSDNTTGRLVHMVAMTRRTLAEPAPTAPEGTAAYEVEIRCGNRRKIYRLTEARPRYADSVRLLEKFLEGI